MLRTLDEAVTIPARVVEAGANSLVVVVVDAAVVVVAVVADVVDESTVQSTQRICQ